MSGYYGAAPPRAGKIDYLDLALQRRRQEMVRYAPEFTGKCSKLKSRARSVNKSMRRVERTIDPTLRSMVKDLKKVTRNLDKVDMLFEKGSDGGWATEAKGPIGKLNGIIQLIKLVPMETLQSTAGSSLEVLGNLQHILRLFGAFDEDTSAAGAEAAVIKSELNYLSGVSEATKKRISFSLVKSSCVSMPVMAEQVCTAHGLGYRRMLKGRVAGVHPAWNDPCDRYTVTSGSKVQSFTHPPRFAPNWYPIPAVYERHGTVHLAEPSCPLGQGCGDEDSIYKEGGVRQALDTLELFFSGPGESSRWEESSADISKSLSAYETAVDQAYDKISALVSLLLSGPVREFIINLLINPAIYAVALAAAAVPGPGAISAGVMIGAAQVGARAAYNAMTDALETFIQSFKSKSVDYISAAQSSLADVQRTWDDAASGTMLWSVRVPYDQVATSLRNFSKAVPKVKYCRKIYPARTPAEWKKIAGDDLWRCPESHISAAPRDRPTVPVPGGSGPGRDTPGGLPTRIASPETEGALGRITLPAEIPWTKILLTGLVGYLIFRERR